MGLFARTKSILTVSFLAALLSLAAFGFLMQRIVSVNQATAQLAENIAVEEKRDQQLRALQDLLEELGSEEVALNERFLGPEGLVPFIELIELVGKEAGVVVEVVSVGIQPDAEKVASHEWLKIALRTEGSWAKVFHFVMMLESIPYAIKFDQVGLSLREDDKAAFWEATFIIRAAKLKTQP